MKYKFLYWSIFQHKMLFTPGFTNPSTTEILGFPKDLTEHLDVTVGCPVYCGMFSSLSGLYPLDARAPSSLLMVVTMSPDIVKCPLMESGQNC